MKQRFLPYSTALFLTLAFALTSCREDTIIKSSLTPAVDNIHTFGIGPDFNNGTDTITMITKTVNEDSLVTSTRLNGFPIFHGLGWLSDPLAGTTAGSIYMQVVPTVVNFAFPANSTVDELVLVLPYSGFTWGDTTIMSSRTVRVYAIDEPFSKDSTFYNFSRLKTKDALIGTATIVTGPSIAGTIKDSVKVLGVNRAPHLRITLSDAFKSDFIAALASDSFFTTFTAALPGFYIVPDTTGPGAALPYFRLNGPADIYSTAGVIAYAHTTGKTDTLIYQFPYNENYCAHFNRVTRNYFNPPTTAGSLLLSTATNDRLLMMQNAPGTTIDVNLPYTQGLFKALPKNSIINRAELVFTKYDTSIGENFFGPARLYPQGINSSGGHYTIADRYPVTDASLDFIDGTPRTVNKGGKTVTEYRINIPREVQKALIQGSNGLHLRIGGTVNFPAAYRLLVGGRGMQDPVYRPSINIIYSKQ